MEGRVAGLRVLPVEGRLLVLEQPGQEASEAAAGGHVKQAAALGVAAAAGGVAVPADPGHELRLAGRLARRSDELAGVLGRPAQPMRMHLQEVLCQKTKTKLCVANFKSNKFQRFFGIKITILFP